MKIFYQPKNWFTISVCCLLIISCKVVKKQEVQIGKRGEREPATVFVSYGVRQYFLDGNTSIIVSGVEHKVDTIKGEFTPVKQRRNWINDSVRYLPVINGFDRLDTVRNSIK